MNQTYNHVSLNYFNTHPSVKTSAVCPISKIFPGKITRLYHQEDIKHHAKLSLVQESDVKIAPIPPFVFTNYAEDDNEYVKSENGTFTVAVESIKLSEVCVRYLAQNYGENCTIFLKWSFFNFPKTTTPYEVVNNVEGKIEGFSITYNIDMNLSLYKYIAYALLSIELHASNHYKQDIIGLGLTPLDYSIELINKTSTCNVSIKNKNDTQTFLKLKLLLKLCCDIEITSNLKNKCKDTTYIDKAEKETSEYFRLKRMHQQDIVAYHEKLSTVLKKSNCLKISRSEISNELKKRVKWLHQECNWKRTLQEHAILKGEDPFLVKNRQWRTGELEKVKLRTFPKYIRIKPTEVGITILSVKFHPNSFVMKDDNIKKIYVEYEFLNYSGIELETPVSLAKTEKVVFNFKKSFAMDLERNSCDCKLLAEFIKTEKEIKFNVVNEPLYRPQAPTLRCSILAYCKINMLDLAESLEDSWNWNGDLISKNNENDIVGSVLVKFEGLLHMRRTALLLLAPPTYKLVE